MKHRRWLDPQLSPLPALGVVMLGLLLVLVAAFLGGCKDASPVEGCGACAPEGTTPPPWAQVIVAMDEGRRQAALTCPGVPAEGHYPSVDWHLCDFKVSGGCPCAAGSTSYDEGRIRISLANRDNVLPLVTWEARNWFWGISGCRNQAI